MSVTKNVFLFTGDNRFGIEQEASRWKRNYLSKFGEDNFHELDGTKVTTQDLCDFLSPLPFITEKRLVILRGVPRCDKDQLSSLIDEIHPLSILLIIEPSLDKRLSISKFLLTACEVKLFPALEGPQLDQWISETTRANGATIDLPTTRHLVNIVGHDQKTLLCEIQKLCLYNPTVITVASINEISIASGTMIIWRLTDCISKLQFDAAVAFLYDDAVRGGDTYGHWTVLLSMVRNTLLVAAALHSGISVDKNIAAATGLHPFVVKNLRSIAGSARLHRLYSLAEWCRTKEIDLKTGSIRHTKEHTSEVQLLCATLIQRLRALQSD